MQSLTATERMGLCLHLARLRPTLEHRKAWSGEDDDTKLPLSWTEFLKSLAPPSIAGEVGIKDPEEVDRRRQLLEKMYAILAAEHDYQEGVIGKCMASSCFLKCIETDGRHCGRW